MFRLQSPPTWLGCYSCVHLAHLIASFVRSSLYYPNRPHNRSLLISRPYVLIIQSDFSAPHAKNVSHIDSTSLCCDQISAVSYMFGPFETRGRQASICSLLIFTFQLMSVVSTADSAASEQVSRIHLKLISSCLESDRRSTIKSLPVDSFSCMRCNFNPRSLWSDFRRVALFQRP